jgi:hypothetical protein
MSAEETITFSGLPSGTTYTITQTNDNGYTSQNSTSGKITSNITEVTISNTKDTSDNPDTGINIKYIPFMLMFLMAICGLIMIKKNKK